MKATYLGLLAALLLSGCGTLDYYSQLAQGQLELLNARQPVSQLLADETTPSELKQRLVLTQQARNFASAHLALPDNDSYRLYADIKRPFVVWNVFATEEFSLSPQLHCFPIAGCVAYRGFYNQGRARGAAALLKQQGLDTYTAGVEAYSTLGWFADPLLNSMLRWSDERVVAVIFHELAHQQFYLAGDSAFNESFATFVEREGLRQWRASLGQASPDDHSDDLQKAFIELVLECRQRLQTLYASNLPAAAMRKAKQAEFNRLRTQYKRLQDEQWGGDQRYDNWVYSPLNNAKLLPFGLYDQWTPAFARLYEQAQGSWPLFYQRVRELAQLPDQEQHHVLTQLTDEPRTKP